MGNMTLTVETRTIGEWRAHFPFRRAPLMDPESGVFRMEEPGVC